MSTLDCKLTESSAECMMTSSEEHSITYIRDFAKMKENVRHCLSLLFITCLFNFLDL